MRQLIFVLLFAGLLVAQDRPAPESTLTTEEALTLENTLLKVELYTERIDQMKVEVERLKAEARAERKAILGRAKLPEDQYDIDLPNKRIVKRQAIVETKP